MSTMVDTVNPRTFRQGDWGKLQGHHPLQPTNLHWESIRGASHDIKPFIINISWRVLTDTLSVLKQKISAKTGGLF